MSWVKSAARFAVGGLFIFSGLIKVNDPVGTAIKLEEYFNVFSSDFASFFGALEPFALYFSIFLVVLEVALGVAVLINFRMPTTSWILLLLILFFTFLTFYSAFFNKVTDCGCFGDAIKLTPWESFTKDLILLSLILVIFPFRYQFKPLFGKRIGDLIIGLVVVVNVYLDIHAIGDHKFSKLRTYKTVGSIPTGMGPSGPLRNLYILEKDGEKFEFK